MAQANSLIVQASRDLVSRVDVLSDVLDGFPVKALIDHYLDVTSGGDPADAKRDAAMMDWTLRSWINNLSLAICDYADCGDNETLERLRDQLKRTQEALVMLRRKLAHVEHLRASSQLSQRPSQSVGLGARKAIQQPVAQAAVQRPQTWVDSEIVSTKT